MPAKRPRTRTPSPLSLFPARDPEILDVQATAQLLGISTHAVYALLNKGELPGRKVARRWLTTRDMVMGWLKGASEQDTLAPAIANGDTHALTEALKSGKAQVKKRQ
jgi:excisionase family DNA binding protein